MDRKKTNIIPFSTNNGSSYNAETEKNENVIGERIAQAVVAKHERVEGSEVAELSSSERGAGGFGSTGRG